MKHLNIDGADVILQDMGDGQGKIIISDSGYGYNFSYFWGAMGARSLEDFLCGINADYFTGKLGPHVAGPVNTKKTITNLRRCLKEYFYSEYPWYTHMEFQKSLRYDLKQLERSEIYSPEDFFYKLGSFVDGLDYYLIDDNYARKNIESIMKDAINSEPWYHLVYDEHREKTYLMKFHAKLKKAIQETKTTENVKTESN